MLYGISYIQRQKTRKTRKKSGRNGEEGRCLGSVNQPDQRNCSTSSNTTDKTHLNSSPDTSDDVIPSTPSTHDARLNISKRQQRHCHHANAIIQRNQNLVDNEIRNQRDESADEITNGQGNSRYPCLVAVRLRFFVVESDEELEETVMRSMQGSVDLADDVGGDTMGGENVTHNGTSFDGRGFDQFFCFAHGGFIRLSASISTCIPTHAWEGKKYASLFAPT